MATATREIFEYQMSPTAKKADMPILVPVADLERIPTNRIPVESHIREIIETWDENRLEPIHVSFRADGTKGVPEGGHRIEVFKRKHANGDKSARFSDYTVIPCWQWTGLSPEDENWLAYRFDADKKAQAAGNRAKFRAGFGDPVITAIIENGEQFGFEILLDNKKQSPSDNKIACIGGIERQISDNGIKCYIETLRTIREGWRGMRGALSEEVLCGLMRFYAAVEVGSLKGEYSYERMIDLMQNDLTPTQVSEEIDTTQVGTFKGRAIKGARAYARLYNVGNPELRANYQLLLQDLFTKDERAYFKKTKGETTLSNGELAVKRQRKRKRVNEE